MNNEQDNINPEVPAGGEPAPVQQQPVIVEKEKPKRSGWRIFWGIILVFSILANIMLVLMLIGLATVFVSGQGNNFTEEVLQSGPRSSKIGIINVEGVIGKELSDEVYRQLKIAKNDSRVKGLILHVNSPGGTVSDSDRIYHEINKYREKTGKPVVAFMDGVAASGGYYSSVACDKIVASPTTITGSIGVIMGYFVLQQLLEEKLGIQPVIIKSGLKKDWPSPFRPATEEEKQYIETKLINPAYERFVKLVADGRKDLTIQDVHRLADGSIYGAEEALNEKLIDKIGYLDDAVDTVKSLAGIEKAEIIEYKKPFSFSEIFAMQGASMQKFEKMFAKFSTPQLMYFWTLN